MQLLIPTIWQCLFSICAPLLVRAMSVCTQSGSNQARGNSGSRDHHSCNVQGGLSKGAITGIVIGSLLFLLVLLLLSLWCYRRRRARRSPIQHAGGTTTFAPATDQDPPSTRLLSDHPPTLRPASFISSSPTDLLPPVLYSLSPVAEHRERSQELHNSHGHSGSSIQRHPSPSLVTLPNPYEQDRPPNPPPRDDLSPHSPISATSHFSPWSSSRHSTAPSSWSVDEVGLLSQRATHTSGRTSSSSLRDELAGYQKRLEAHVRKESEGPTRSGNGGESSRLLADPPPVYSDDRSQGVRADVEQH